MNTPASEQDGQGGSLLFELNEFLPYRLSLLTNTVSAGIARSYRDQHEISVIEWRIMAVLGRYPGLTASEIGERTAMDKVAISRAVKNLVARGLLQRVTDPLDRRRIHLELSPDQGQNLLAEIIPLAQDYEKQLMESLTREDQLHLSAMLKALQQKAESLNPPI